MSSQPLPSFMTARQNEPGKWFAEATGEFKLARRKGGMKTLLSAGGLGWILLLASCSKGEQPMPNIEGETLSSTPQKAAAQIENPLRKFAENAQGSFACGLYLNRKKVGYLIASSKIIKRGDSDFFEQRMETRIEATKNGKPFTDKSTLTRLFNLDGKGELTSVEQVSERDGATYTSTIIKQGDKYLETSSGGKSTKSITIEPPKTSLINDKQLSDWLKSSPKAGDEFDYKSSDFNGGEFNEHNSQYKYISRKDLVINGVATTIHSLEQRDDRDDEVTKYDCDNNGRLIRGNFGPVTFRLEEEATARKLDTEGIDLIEASSVPTNVRMGDPRKLKQVLLKISGIKYSLPNSQRQMQTTDGKAGGWTTLMINRDFQSAEKEPITQEQLAKYLRATPTIQSDNAQIKAKAEEITAGQKTPKDKARHIQEWVNKLIDKDLNRNSNTALEVMERKAGDCTEHALLFNALARAAGIPSREATGLMYTQSPQPVFYWHAWNEIHDGTRWISVDPTWDEVFVDAGHIKISDDDTIKIANSFGKMKIEIISFQTDDVISVKDAFKEPEKPKHGEESIVLTDVVPPPPRQLHYQLNEPPPAINMGAASKITEAPQPKLERRKDLGKPIEQFSGAKLNQIQFDKAGHLVE